MSVGVNIDYDAYHLAIRTAALGLSVATTGSTSLSATALGFARAAGSFITDGFALGMEVTATGFSAANNAAKVITGVTAGFLTISGGCVAQSATAGRTILCGLPSQRAWENVVFVPTPGSPYAEEQFLPGPPPKKVTTSSDGELELLPMYQLQIHVPDNTGILANGKYAYAIQSRFSPNTTIALAGGAVLRVRSDIGPFRSQRQPSRPGYSVVPVTIPFYLRTTAPINTL